MDKQGWISDICFKYKFKDKKSEKLIFTRVKRIILVDLGLLIYCFFFNREREASLTMPPDLLIYCWHMTSDILLPTHPLFKPFSFSFFLKRERRAHKMVTPPCSSLFQSQDLCSIDQFLGWSKSQISTLILYWWPITRQSKDRWWLGSVIPRWRINHLTDHKDKN